MQGIILAAGRGTRMGALTERTPKPMLLIKGKPLLEWRLEMLPEGIDEVIVTIGYLGEQIEEYFGEQWQGRKIIYVRQERLDGTGGAMRLIHERGLFSSPALVTMGDDLYQKDDLERLMRHDLGVLACERADASKFGVLEKDADGKLRRIIERPHAQECTLVNTGAYMLHEAFFEYPPVRITDLEYGLPQTLVQMRDKHDIGVLETKSWFPIGDPEALESAQTEIESFFR